MYDMSFGFEKKKKKNLCACIDGYFFGFLQVADMYRSQANNPHRKKKDDVEEDD